jgi:hypothetical protein
MTMKKKARVRQRRAARTMALSRRVAFGVALAFAAGAAATGAEEEAAKSGETEGAGGNWIELGAGGLFTSGNQSQAEQARRLSEGAFGGIQDLHFQREIAKATTFSLDGRGILDEHDYRFALGLKKEEVYFLRLDFGNFRTWSNGDGGFYPAAGAYYPLPGDALALDVGEVSLEGGLTLKNWPGLRFKYSHLYRDGEKGSTIWGQTHPGLVFPSSGLVPTVRDIDEKRDIIELEVTHRIKKTDFGVGAVYEFGDLNNARKISQYPGELPVAGVAQDRKITDRQDESYDLFNVHAFSETWIRPNLFFSAGYMFSDLDNDTTGSRVWGDDFDVAFAPNAGNGQGYTNLLSSARKQDHVLNLNLMSRPARTLTVTPSVRVERQDWDANSSAYPTYGNNVFGATGSAADADAIDVRERLDIRYSGITNWVFTAQGEWTEGQGNMAESGGIFNAATTPGAPLQRETEETRFFQKYSLGAKWHPTRRLSVDAGGYYKRNEYDYDHKVDSTPNNSIANRYPAYLTMQDFETYDGNARLTWRPVAKLTLVSRYEYQFSTVNTTPDPASGLTGTESAKLNSHVFAQNASWQPWSRLYLQAGFNYVVSELKTPASDYTAAILEAQNNYWSVNFNSGFVLDDKTDLSLGYTYYRADNDSDASAVAIPYGSDASEHGVNATLSRRINKNLRAQFRYGYYTYSDASAGGHRDYDAHVVYSSLQYRF